MSHRVEAQVDFGRKALADNLQSGRPELSATEARSGRIVKGGAMRRILWTSLALAIVAVAVAYFAMAQT